jgi:alternate signal-mediated exported protein
MKNNKKKANKEKRVMAAALCITAVAVAGSTFAWFTSTDEVTNRLSANADYNVSIVESFEPPFTWLPGQVVNKDVYATNTGNIGAYVNEDVSGVLTITTEKPQAEWDAGCVELTEEERYVMEAGAFLAYKPAGSNAKLGDQVVIRPGDQGTPAKTDFTPDADGLYVFRRSIVVDGTRAETFDYEGYEYQAGKYYKVDLTSVTADDTADLANDGVKTDGNLSAATARYFKEVQEVVNPVDLEYDSINNRLVATYDTGNSNADNLADLAKAYDDAIEDFERTKEALDRAIEDAAATNTTLTNEKTALDEAKRNYESALATQKAAATALANATAAKTNAENAMTAAQAAVNESKTNLYGGVDRAENNYTENSLKGKYNKAHGELTTLNGRDQFLADFNAWAASGENQTGKTVLDDFTYDEFLNFPKDSQNQVFYEKVAAEKRAKEAYEAELKKLIGSTDPADPNAPTANSLQGKLDAATADLGDADSGKTKAYNDAVNAKTTADGEVNRTKGLYDTALGTYTAAANASGLDTTDLSKARADFAAASAKKTAAQKAYDAANNAAVTDGKLKININLSDKVVTTADGTNDKWLLDPATIGADKTAHFYYTGILEGSETSSKLIDSVELDDSVTQNMYKSFDFDINVALKSAQITYADDNETILPTAATEEIGKTPTLTAPTDINTALTWSDPTP